MIDPIVNDVLKAFKKKYPNLSPLEMFGLNDGYVICAPKTGNQVDYNDPYYYIDSTLSTVEPFKMSRKMDLFKAISAGSIWKRG